MWKRRIERWLDALGASSLKARAAMAVALTIVTFTLAMAAADLMAAYRDVRRDVETQTETTARLVAELASERIAQGELTDLYRTVGLIALSGGLDKIVVHDTRTNRTLIATTDDVTVVPDLTSEAARDALGRRAPLLHTAGEQITAAVPFLTRSDGGPRGVVAVTASTQLYAAKRQAAILRSAVIAGVFIVLLVPTLGAVAGRFIGPIQELTQAMRRVAQGELDVKIDIQRKDEIGDLVHSFRHMTRKLKTLAAEERRLAYVDPVTGLANRERIQRAVEAVARRAAADHSPRALLFIDLDGFKRVNDVFGHDVGDKLLAAVGQRFSTVAEGLGYTMISPLNNPPRSDQESRYAFLGRLGGDEFVMVARFLGESRAEADALATALLDAIHKPFDVDGQAVEVGASIGIARIPEDGRDGRTVMRHADLAMYEAKEAGRGRHCFFTEDMSQKMLDRLVLEMELRRAVGNDEFDLYYMPKIDLRTGTLVGFEALARWQHPAKGLLPPSVFIPLAEETGLISDIDRLVLKKALRQAADWSWNRSALPIAVNMSAKDFSRPSLVMSVARALKEAEVPGRLLEIEITESAAMVDPLGAAQVMTELKRLGVRFAIDDFGTGFSNLGQLLKLPVDVFKIDRTFVQYIQSNGEAHHIVKTIVALADQLGLETVAEGIESAEQAEILARLGVHFGQGFYYGAPVQASEAEALIQHHFPRSPEGAWMV